MSSDGVESRPATTRNTFDDVPSTRTSRVFTSIASSAPCRCAWAWARVWSSRDVTLAPTSGPRSFTGHGATTTSTDDDHGTDDVDGPTTETAVAVYLLDDEEKIRVGHIRMADDIGVAAAALESLFEGPTADDEALGLSTTIPEGTTLRSIDLAAAR